MTAENAINMFLQDLIHYLSKFGFQSSIIQMNGLNKSKMQVETTQLAFLNLYRLFINCLQKSIEMFIIARPLYLRPQPFQRGKVLKRQVFSVNSL